MCLCLAEVLLRVALRCEWPLLSSMHTACTCCLLFRGLCEGCARILVSTVDMLWRGRRLRRNQRSDNSLIKSFNKAAKSPSKGSEDDSMSTEVHRRGC